MFLLMVTPQDIDTSHKPIKNTPTKVYAIGVKLLLSKVPLEELQNWVLIQLIVTPHILEKVLGQIKEVCRLIEPCLLIGTREYSLGNNFSRLLRVKVWSCLDLIAVEKQPTWEYRNEWFFDSCNSATVRGDGQFAQKRVFKQKSWAGGLL